MIRRGPQTEKIQQITAVTDPPVGQAPSAIQTVVADELNSATPDPLQTSSGTNVELDASKVEAAATDAIVPIRVASFIVQTDADGVVTIKPSDGTASKLTTKRNAYDLRITNPSNGQQLLIVIANVTEAEPQEDATDGTKDVDTAPVTDLSTSTLTPQEVHQPAADARSAEGSDE
jgi:leucyl-tRNA synthetase